MPERVLAPVSHSADSHRADGLASCSSADSHRADDVSPDTMLAVSSYNVSKQGLEALCVCFTVVVEVVEPGLPPAHSMPVRGNFGSSIWLHKILDAPRVPSCALVATSARCRVGRGRRHT